MINEILVQELAKYNVRSIDDVKNAIREIGQRIILCGLSRSSFFDYVAFYGGTSLRLLRNLDRFSEDLDFTLIKSIKDFKFDYYLSSATKELENYGIKSTYTIKEKNINTTVLTSYIKFNLQETINLLFENTNFMVNKEENLSIKVEVETNYIEGFKLEFKTILFPKYFKVLTFDLSTMFSCKLLAILNRSWKNRVKGRDYFDFLFYLTNNVKPNYIFLANGLKLESINEKQLKELLFNKFNEIDFIKVKSDVLPFVQNNNRFLDLFSKEIFIDLLNEI